MTLIGVADLAASHGWGLLSAMDLPPPFALVAGLLARSLVSYAVHVAMHKVPFLWRLHRVHHLDPHLDVSTTARMHPVEALASAPLTMMGVLILGPSPTAVLIYEILDAALVVFSHANIRLPLWLDRRLSLVFVTPDLHRVHHSAHQPETDSNYGATLSIWDRMFGTFRRLDAATLARLKLGLHGVDEIKAGQIGWLLTSPILKLDRSGAKDDHDG